MPQRAISILLVEDSALDARLLLEGLKPAITSGEVFVQSVKRLGQAMEEMRTNDFSCVLLDLGLPDGQGIGNVSALRGIDPKAAIVVLTGLDDEKVAVEALKLGAQDYLVKGAVTPGDGLIRLVRRAVQRNRQTVALETRRDQAFFEASHDARTLLPNEALFTDRARQFFHSPQAVAMGCVDVGGLVDVRSRFGPVVADELLKRCTQMLTEGLEPPVTAGHLGESRFGVVGLPVPALERHLAAVAEHIAGVSQVGGCTVSLAPRYSAVASAGFDFDQWFDEALARLERAETVSAQTRPAAAAAAPVGERAVDAALWQPWADLRDGRFAGVELLRGESDTTPLAERLQQLAQQAQRWQATHCRPPVLSLAVRQDELTDVAAMHALVAHCRGAGLQTSAVQFNIAESAFRSEGEHGAALAQLRRDGFRLALDGDGSADITLAHFAGFPVDVYRLSPAFVRQLLAENLQGHARRLLTALLGAATALGATVIAQGVASREALAALRLVGVNAVQGRAVAPECKADTLPIVWERGPATG